MEIEQRAQEQRMQIESTASQLCMQAQQQKLQKEMSDRMAKLQKEQADREAKAQMTMPTLPQQTTVTGSYVPPAQYSTLSALMPQPIYADAGATTFSTMGNLSSYPGNISSYPGSYGGTHGYSGQPQVIRTVRVVNDTQPAPTTTVSS
ncbi:hypothetical protein Pmar_PMAR008539 [Perkinsus marinus ATCC 50983]|uniref:Uncharacterized protein n=1 Tax=Perkinsus marinus (strain ATCC 50983 / TXsc) TaxID=423536 RepID=C5KQD1_PERM5|nr:hypothetical protein Pmar_PMAR008539 [Perkinsus marinus ATCC 50983]EER13313.1 hypothetical protein Pmar_PMAR008539 [Perkinsus marinus ATCC 50983]|eukprot:XP_002781518.1 hypothetical protein Pmar_PMAR008539 [Perkinsus marinus ATCC 50983]